MTGPSKPSLSDAVSSAASAVGRSLSSGYDAASSYAGNVMGQTQSIMDRARSGMGINVDSIRQGLADLAAQNPQLVDSVRTAVNGLLTPVQMGDLLSERVAPPTISTAADFAIPATPADAPLTITISPINQLMFDVQWATSFVAGTGATVEQGSTMTFDRATGRIGLENFGGLGSTTASFDPNLNVANPATTGVIGVFHTHPYGPNEGNLTGVSLSGGDAAYMVNNGLNVIIAQSGTARNGTTQFMFMRTEQSPTVANQRTTHADSIDRIGNLMAQGMDFPTASRHDAVTMAQYQFGFAYYEGSNGNFTRVYP